MYTQPLKKLGLEFGMEPARDRILGKVDGLTACMFDTPAGKVIAVAVNVRAWEEVSPKKEYRISQVKLDEGSVAFLFPNSLGVIKRMRAFLQAELPALNARGLGTGIRCPHCDEQVGSDASPVVLGDELALFHRDCIEPYDRQLQRDWDIEKHEPVPAGSGILGFAGALLGGFVGAIPWIVISVAGYIASIAGTAIALAANFGHKKFGGRPGRSRVASVVVVTILMVFVASVLSVVAGITWAVITGEMEKEMGLLPGSLKLSIFLPRYLEILCGDPEMCVSFVKDLALGYVFAGLGLFSALRGKMREENKSGKIEVRRLDV